MRTHWIAASLVLCAAAPTLAGTIVVPQTTQGPAGSPVSSGSTFVSDDQILDSFTIRTSGDFGGGTFLGAVFATAAGVPTGSPIWTSTTQSVANLQPFTTFTFAPGLAIGSGTTIWVGLVSGGTFGGGTSGAFRVALNHTNPYPFGQSYLSLAGGTPTSPVATNDLATTIVFNPEPATTALFGLGAAALGGLVWRRRRAAKLAKPA